MTSPLERLAAPVGEMLQQRMRESHKYEEAMRRFLERPPVMLNRSRKRYPKRDDLHVGSVYARAR